MDCCLGKQQRTEIIHVSLSTRGTSIKVLRPGTIDLPTLSITLRKNFGMS